MNAAAELGSSSTPPNSNTGAVVDTVAGEGGEGETNEGTPESNQQQGSNSSTEGVPVLGAKLVPHKNGEVVAKVDADIAAAVDNFQAPPAYVTKGVRVEGCHRTSVKSLQGTNHRYNCLASAHLKYSLGMYPEESERTNRRLLHPERDSVVSATPEETRETRQEMVDGMAAVAFAEDYGQLMTNTVSEEECYSNLNFDKGFYRKRTSSSGRATRRKPVETVREVVGDIHKQLGYDYLAVCQLALVAEVKEWNIVVWEAKAGGGLRIVEVGKTTGCFVGNLGRIFCTLCTMTAGATVQINSCRGHCRTCSHGVSSGESVFGQRKAADDFFPCPTTSDKRSTKHRGSPIALDTDDDNETETNSSVRSPRSAGGARSVTTAPTGVSKPEAPPGKAAIKPATLPSASSMPATTGANESPTPAETPTKLSSSKAQELSSDAAKSGTLEGGAAGVDPSKKKHGKRKRRETCHALFASGNRQGQRCGAEAKSPCGVLCSMHSKKGGQNRTCGRGENGRDDETEYVQDPEGDEEMSDGGSDGEFPWDLADYDEPSVTIKSPEQINAMVDKGGQNRTYGRGENCRDDETQYAQDPEGDEEMSDGGSDGEFPGDLADYDEPSVTIKSPQQINAMVYKIPEGWGKAALKFVFEFVQHIHDFRNDRKKKNMAKSKVHQDAPEGGGEEGEEEKGEEGLDTADEHVWITRGMKDADRTAGYDGGQCSGKDARGGDSGGDCDSSRRSTVRNRREGEGAADNDSSHTGAGGGAAGSFGGDGFDFDGEGSYRGDGRGYYDCHRNKVGEGHDLKFKPSKKTLGALPMFDPEKLGRCSADGLGELAFTFFCIMFPAAVISHLVLKDRSSVTATRKRRKVQLAELQDHWSYHSFHDCKLVRACLPRDMFLLTYGRFFHMASSAAPKRLQDGTV
ncbi:unnamed protein product [Ectocarpus sp. CCAP 1310/34]|nr:unnamed protein product [Ectocarpus sp. CCAP 1310/34]